MKISKQTVGENRTLIKISADNKKELIEYFYYYTNYGNSVCIRKGADIEEYTGLTFLNVLENEAYFTADTQEFIKTLINLELHKLSRKTQHEKHISDKMRDKAKVLGQKMWESIEETNVFKDSAETEFLLTAD